MLLPYWTLLLPVVLGIVIYGIWMAANVYHLVKFGFFDFTGKLNLFIFTALSVIVIGFGALTVSTVDWSERYDIAELPGLIIPTSGGGEANTIY
jgi:hypothetical protein